VFRLVDIDRVFEPFVQIDQTPDLRGANGRRTRTLDQQEPRRAMRGDLTLPSTEGSAPRLPDTSDCVGDFVGLPDCDGDPPIMFA